MKLLASILLLAVSTLGADKPVVDPALALKIRTVELDQARAQGTATQLQQVITSYQQRAQDDAKQLADLETQVLAAAKLDPKHWKLDLESLELQPILAPPAPTPAKAQASPEAPAPVVLRSQDSPSPTPPH